MIKFKQFKIYLYCTDTSSILFSSSFVFYLFDGISLCRCHVYSKRWIFSRRSCIPNDWLVLNDKQLHASVSPVSIENRLQ